MPASRTMRTRRPNGAPQAPVRSVRITDAVWEKARRRAEYEGVTMSDVLASFTKGYAEGYIDRPVVQVTYTRARVPVPAVEPPDET